MSSMVALDKTTYFLCGGTEKQVLDAVRAGLPDKSGITKSLLQLSDVELGDTPFNANTATDMDVFVDTANESISVRRTKTGETHALNYPVFADKQQSRDILGV